MPAVASTKQATSGFERKLLQELWPTKHSFSAAGLADDAFCSNCFDEQRLAREALVGLLDHPDAVPDELNSLCGIVVDELQDFTLLQIALVAQLGVRACGPATKIRVRCGR